MAVDAIGALPSSATGSSASTSNISQDEFIRLFLAQLQFQDPMEPVDNREFLSQLAQFTSLEQSRQTSQNTTDLLSMNSSAQAISLLGRQVEVLGLSTEFAGTVIAVTFTQTGPQLTVRNPATNDTQTAVRLSQISLVRP